MATLEILANALPIADYDITLKTTAASRLQRIHNVLYPEGTYGLVIDSIAELSRCADRDAASLLPRINDIVSPLDIATEWAQDNFNKFYVGVPVFDDEISDHNKQLVLDTRTASCMARTQKLYERDKRNKRTIVA